MQNSDKKNVVILIDKSPLDFDVPQEFDLFNDELSKLRAGGKDIFVVSTEGEETTSTINNGIRYINLGKLYTDGGLNPDFRILRFRVSGGEVHFELQKIF